MLNKYNTITRDHIDKRLKMNLWKKSNEIFCLGILRLCFYPKFESFIPSDSPDLIDIKGEVGFEVCEAISERDAQTRGEFTRLGDADSKQSEKRINIIKANGHDCYQGMLFWKVRDENYFLVPLKEVLKKKLKLVDYYFKNNIREIGLVVYCETHIINNYSNEIINIYKELCIINNVKKKYDYLAFIFIYGMYFFDIKNDKCCICQIEKVDFEYISLLSRFIAEGRININDKEWKNLIS